MRRPEVSNPERCDGIAAFGDSLSACAAFLYRGIGFNLEEQHKK
jgi:hypothetical protein